MQVFVTGASGFVGSAVVAELIAAGHKVIGLARSDEGAARVAQAGAQVHRGDIYDLDSLRSGAALADGVIHTAFNHDFSKFQENCETDRRVIDTLGSVLAGSARPLIVTSGTGVLAPGQKATENDRAATGPDAHPRTASEHAAAAQAARGVKTSVIRLPPTVHGKGDHGFVPMLIAIAREKGVTAYPGDGSNLWPAVHRFDAAKVYRLALERGADDARYHAVAEEGVPFCDIAAAIGRGLDLPVTSKQGEAAAAHFGWFAHFAAMNVPASSAWTREVLGWQPTQPELLTDLVQGGYFTV